MKMRKESRSPSRIYSKLQECYVCQQELTNDIATSKNCGHVFHYSCVMDSIDKKEECPYCRKAMKKNDIVQLILNYDDIDENQVATNEWQLTKRSLTEFENKYEDLEEKYGGIKNENDKLIKDKETQMRKIQRRETKINNLVKKFERSNLLKQNDRLIERFPTLSDFAKKVMKDYKDLLDKEVKPGQKTEYDRFPFVGPLHNEELCEIYEGQYLNCKKEGVGKVFYGKEDAYYYGTFHEDKRHGFGIVIKKNNSYIVGEWKDNKVWGNALYKRENGDYYEGQWYDNKKHGAGKELIAEEKIYLGKYINNEKMDTNAKVVMQKTGQTYKGTIIKGEMQGSGEMFWRNGSVYKGTWCKNMMQGPGIQVDNEGNMFKGNFIENRKHGEFKRISNKGEIKKLFYRNGSLIREKTADNTIVIN